MSEFDPIKLEKEIRMGMNLVDRDEFNPTIRAVSHIAASTVQKTLGPYAHTTIIDDGTSTHPTKDGWSILQRLRFQDPTHQSIFTMLKNISFRIVDKVGDGTTTAMVTADHFMERMSKWIEEHPDLYLSTRQSDIVDALNNVRDYIIAELKDSAIRIAPDPSEENPTFDDIYNIAFVSSNGNEKLAEIMQAIYRETRNPNMLVDMEGGHSISYEIQKGYRLDCACLMHERYVNTSEHYYNTNHLLHMVFIFDHNVTYQKHAEMIDALNRYAAQKRCIPIFMAPNFDDVMTSVITVNIENQMKKNAQAGHPNAIPGMFVIQIPEMMRELQKNYVYDFAALAGGSLINSTKVRLFTALRHNEKTEDDLEKIHDPLNDLEGYKFSCAQDVINSCGFVIQDAIIGKNFITLQDVNHDNPYYKTRLTQAKEAYAKATAEAAQSPTSYTKALLDATQRLNKLSGALGVIHVGGVTDLERECTKDFVDDTFQACRSAYENGIVPGMNLGTLVAIKRIATRHSLSETEKAVLIILDAAFRMTTYDIMVNKYPQKTIDDPAWEVNIDAAPNHYKWTARELVAYLVDEVDRHNISSYDMVSETAFTDRKPIICNSVSTDIEILYGITSILGMILTSDQYLSVNRMYDKMAAIRQQEAVNEKATINRVNTILSSVDQYLINHPNSKLTDLVKLL